MRRDRRGRGGGNGRSRGWTPSLCLAMLCRLWWRMCRREPRRRGLANRRGASRGWPWSWWWQWPRNQRRARSPASRILKGRKALIYKELKFLNIYKLGGDGINTSLAAGFRLVAKVSLVYVFEASIITFIVLMTAKVQRIFETTKYFRDFFVGFLLFRGWWTGVGVTCHMEILSFFCFWVSVSLYILIYIIKLINITRYAGYNK